MTSKAAALPHVSYLGGRGVSLGDCRRALRSLAGLVGFSLGVVATACALIVAAMFAAVWMFSSAVPHTTPVPISPFGPAAISLAGKLPPPPPLVKIAAGTPIAVPADRPHTVFADEWARTSEAMYGPKPAPRPAEPPENSAPPQQVANLSPAPTAPPTDSVPLPRSHPQVQEAPKIAAVPRYEISGRQPGPQVAALPGIDNRTAVYDIVARVVYLPNGERLEAHSGLGEMMDDPRYIKIKNRGPTPPNVYDLTLREALFHGVRAIRLNPVDENKMFDRDGMLAHTYMLGSNGQSNGCVSFRDYDRFLQAFLRGDVNRLVVVPHLDRKPVFSASAENGQRRYAASNL